MDIKVNRFCEDEETTISTVSINGLFECFGLEDEFREVKMAGETRIPAGRYKVKLRTVGGFHTKYSKRFGSEHHGMLQVMDVPGFEYILIHLGNDDDDTDGCLLVGAGCNTANGLLTIQSSTIAYKSMYEKVWQAAANDDLWIEYID